MSLKHDIITAEDLPVQKVTIEHWPDGVYVRTLNVAELDIISSYEDDAGTGQKPKPAETLARSAALVLSDSEGNRIFTDDEYTLLTKKPLVALKAIVDAALELNGVTQEAMDAIEGN
jgi:hypothetical protein